MNKIFVFFLIISIWACKKQMPLQDIKISYNTTDVRWIEDKNLKNRFRKDIYFWNKNGHVLVDDDLSNAAVGFYEVKNENNQWLEGYYTLSFEKRLPFGKSEKKAHTLILFQKGKGLVYVDLSKVLDPEEEGAFEIVFYFEEYPSSMATIAEKTIPILIKKDRSYDIDFFVFKSEKEKTFELLFRKSNQQENAHDLTTVHYYLNGQISRCNLIFEREIAWCSIPQWVDTNKIHMYAWIQEKDNLLVSASTHEAFTFEEKLPKFCYEKYGAQYQKKILEKIAFHEAILHKKNRTIVGMELSALKDTTDLSDLPCFYELNSLKIGQGYLTSFPKGLQPLAHLDTLIIEKNPIQNFDISYFPTNLKSLSLNHFDTLIFPEYWNHLQKLTHLNLSNNHLTNLPLGLKKLPELYQLDLSHNNFSTWPNILDQVSSHLRYLNLSYNQFASLPKHFGKRRNLSKLNFSHNKILFLEKDFLNLGEIGELDVSHNQILFMEYDFWFKAWETIHSLNLSHNQLFTFFEDTDKHQTQNARLKKLDLSHNRLKDVYSLGNIHSLTHIDLSNNDLNQLPESFKKLRLYFLNLENNHFTHCSYLEDFVFRGYIYRLIVMNGPSKSCFFL